VLSATIVVLLAINTGTLAQKKYDTGATDTEIKIGNIMPYSGSASAYGVEGKTEAAYFNKINAEGGINGRKNRFISYDDAYSPPMTVEQARKLLESDEALLIFNPLGTASNAAIQKYMNEKKVPQLFVGSGARRWNDPQQFPWTMGWAPNYQSEGRIYAKYILKERPTGEIGILYQNDDYGKDYVKGNREVQNAMTGYNVAQTMVYVLKKCGDDLTRANIMKQAAGIKSLQLEGLLPGATINTSATDFAPIKQFQLRKFKDERWELFGDVVSSEIDE
jgi:hypothetical protein